MLLSIANIPSGPRMKASSAAFCLVAYLPIPKFKDNIAKPVQAALTARIFHHSLSIITSSLRAAEHHGHLMPDPNGVIRTCYTPLISYIADLPEQRMIACVRSNQSPTSLASQDQFGDGEQRPPRTRANTLGRMAGLMHRFDPAHVAIFVREAALVGLNGVHQPFWRDWGPADPSLFLTPDALHAWHKFFFDHVVKWIINIMGGEELDRRMSALQRRVGVRHWSNGISKLKQCTGREHRDLEKIIVVVIAGAVHRDVLRAIRALIEFIFQAQAILLYDEQMHAIALALQEFHHFKNAIIIAGGRLGKNGPIPHFNIPKLEGMGRVVYNARIMGAPFQYTSDITERCHITLVKEPYRHSNKRNFHEQCARYMDRTEKARLFQLFTTIQASGTGLVNKSPASHSLLTTMVDEASQLADHYPEATWLSHVQADGVHCISGPASRPNLARNRHHQVSDDFSTVFLVNVKPHHPSLSVREAALKFALPDFHPALGDFFTLGQAYDVRKGQRKSSNTCMLPFSHVDVWINLRLQQHSTQDPSILLPVTTVQALPPSDELPFGRCNTVLINNSTSGSITTSSGDDRESPIFIIIFNPNIPSV